ncbi:MAG: 23S rRNA (pseudouridine(1915)-N(3))-methyltransferase RlmH [Betaproteobacteria bacterium]|nr:MAG: 23S rRNA (pseudouridine(1915)-N(3))-methyltransferase RlmH [Betaproteobacteria bacterium]
MRLKLIALGHNQPRWVSEGTEEYAKRFPAEWPFELAELKPERRTSSKSVEAVLADEALRIRAQVPKQALLIALDERGQQLTTRELAAHMETWQREAACACFLVGSADGLDATLKQSAQHRLGLSKLTLPHGMARVLLIEQLYRAVSLLSGHPYHRD